MTNQMKELMQAHHEIAGKELAMIKRIQELGLEESEEVKELLKEVLPILERVHASAEELIKNILKD